MRCRRDLVRCACAFSVASLAAVFAGCEASGSGGLASERSVGRPEIVATFDELMPTGVAVSDDARVFVNFPRWGDDVPFTVAELVSGEAVPFPNERINRGNTALPSETLISVQSVVICPRGLLWLLDTGSTGFGPVVPGGAKLVGVDLRTDEVVRTIVLGPEAALEATYLNDVRFDYTRGADGLAYITDSSLTGDNAIIVVDLRSGDAWRKLSGHESVLPEPDFVGWIEGRAFLSHPAGAEASPLTVGADGIALSADGERLWYTPLCSRRLFSVDLDALADRFLPDAAVARTVVDHGDRGFASDGLESDGQGRLYLTNYEDNGVVEYDAPAESFSTLVSDPRMLWPDTLDLGLDGSLYITTNQLHRQGAFNAGVDLRRPPYVLWRVPVRATPVRLGR